MIREVIRANDTKLTIDIPENYVGKEIEYIVFPLNEENEPISKNKKDISSLKGVLHKYADASKIELEDKAWVKHVKEKFKIDD